MRGALAFRTCDAKEPRLSVVTYYQAKRLHPLAKRVQGDFRRTVQANGQ